MNNDIRTPRRLIHDLQVALLDRASWPPPPPEAFRHMRLQAYKTYRKLWDDELREVVEQFHSTLRSKGLSLGSCGCCGGSHVFVRANPWICQDSDMEDE